MSMVLDLIAFPPAMLLYGLLTHFLKDMARIKAETGALMHPGDYVAEFPVQTALALVGALAGLGALHTTGELTAVTAYGVGYMANSVADIIGKRSLDRL